MKSTRHRLAMFSAIAVVVCVSAVVAALPATTATLYSVVYPGPGSNVISHPEDLNKALSNAALQTQFDKIPLVQFEPSTLTATLTYGATPPPAGPLTVQVAYANDAILTGVVDGQFSLTPVTDRRKNLDQGTLQPDGGYKLQWKWSVTPLASGHLTLNLDFLPIVIINGVLSKEALERNQPIPIDVDVNPVQQGFDNAVESASDLNITVPDRVAEGEETIVTASLPVVLKQDLRADVVLAQGPPSVPFTIIPVSSHTGGEANWSWKVTPTQPGTVHLFFTVRLRAMAGDRALDKTVALDRYVTADPAPPSFWSRLQQPVLYLTPILAFIAAVIALATKLRRRAGAGDPDGTGPSP